MDRKSVLLLTSHRLDWGAVRQALRSDDAVALTEAISAHDALHVAASMRPDVVILPAAIEDRSTIGLMRAIHTDRSPESRIVVFARTADEQVFAELIDLDVAGILFWRDVGNENYLDYLRTLIHGGATVYSPQADRLWRAMQRGRLWLLGDQVQLTPREQAILRGLYAGLSREEIGLAEHVSERTVKRDIDQLMERLDAHHQFILGAKAALLGFIP